MITIEALEALVDTLAQTEQQRRAKLLRLIRAYARIIAIASPASFTPRATEYADEDGHWDGSYPPKVRYKNRSGPMSIKVVNNDHEKIATSTGFYHDYKVVATDPGLWIGPDGALWGGAESGTGRIGAFAAHPGPCGVDCTIEWSRLDPDEVPLDRLIAAEEKLRNKAFPLIAAKQS